MAIHMLGTVRTVHLRWSIVNKDRTMFVRYSFLDATPFPEPCAVRIRLAGRIRTGYWLTRRLSELSSLNTQDVRKRNLVHQTRSTSCRLPRPSAHQPEKVQWAFRPLSTSIRAH